MKLHIWRLNEADEMELEIVTVVSKRFEIVVESTDGIEGIDEGDITITENDEGYLLALVRKIDTAEGDEI